MKIRVEELMTGQVVSVSAKDSVARADEVMRSADVHHLPVIDERRHVIGVVSQRDLLQAMCLPDGPGRPVDGVMSREVFTVLPETPASEAAALMLDHRIGSLPVVDEHDQLIGIVTAADFLAVAHHALQGRIGAQLLRV